MIIAIDGTVCSGKSTIAKRLAKHLGFSHLNTGAIYRAITIKALNCGYNEGDIKKIKEMLEQTTVEQFRDDSGQMKVVLDGADVTDVINTPTISQNVSHYSKIVEVRDFVKKVQKDLSKKGDWVIEGRDIGTVVFPEAELKIFMTADVLVRAKRRQNDYIRQGKNMPLDDVKMEILARDKEDMERKISPLKPADDAVIYYNDGSDIDKVIDELSKLVVKGNEIG